MRAWLQLACPAAAGWRSTRTCRFIDLRQCVALRALTRPTIVPPAEEIQRDGLRSDTARAEREVGALAGPRRHRRSLGFFNRTLPWRQFPPRKASSDTFRHGTRSLPDQGLVCEATPNPACIDGPARQAGPSSNGVRRRKTAAGAACRSVRNLHRVRGQPINPSSPGAAASLPDNTTGTPLLGQVIARRASSQRSERSACGA